MVLTSFDEVWFTSGLEVTRQLQSAGISVPRPTVFASGDFKNTTLYEIKRSGTRIIIFMAYDQDTYAVASSATAEGMDAGWSWVMLMEITAVVQMAGWLYFRPFLPAEGMQAFAVQVSKYTAAHFNITVSPDSVDLSYSVALHAAVMLYAHAATRVLSEGGDLRDGLAVTQAVRSTTIEGADSSVVALNSDGDRIQSYEVMNYVIEADGRINSVAVGVWDRGGKWVAPVEKAVIWPGNTTEVWAITI